MEIDLSYHKADSICNTEQYLPANPFTFSYIKFQI